MRDRRPIVIAVAGLLAMSAAIGLSFVLDDDDDERGRAPWTRKPPGSMAAGHGTGDDGPPPLPPAPRLTVLRVNDDGDMVLAGRAGSWAEVAILDGGVELGRAKVDRHGDWVFVPHRRLPPGRRTVTLVATDASGAVASLPEEVVLDIAVVPWPLVPRTASSTAAAGDTGGITTGNDGGQSANNQEAPER